MKKTTVLIISLITLIVLAGIAIGSGISGLIVKTNNEDYREDPEFYKSMGNFFAGDEDYTKAIPAYEKSLTLAEDPEVRSNLAVIYHRQENYNKAIEHLRVLVEIGQDNPSYHYDLAVNLVDKFRETEDKQLQDLVDAIAEYEIAEQLEPGYMNAKENVEVLKEVLKTGDTK